jgi:AcrR family transcriptional regulator
MPAARSNKRAQAARDALIRAGERLFGDFGVEAVSLRQIVSAAGFSNNFAVQYHFGDKAGLVDAIFIGRIADLEQRRGELMQVAAREGRADDPATLVRILYRPIAELCDRDGRRTYAAFLLALQQSAEGYRARLALDALAPVTRDLMRRLAAATPHVPAALNMERRMAASALVFTGMVQRDRQGGDAAIESELLDDAFHTATAVLTASVADHVRRALSGSGGG